MSRCFPFPPPGYEKKARTDDVDLLKKEKHREKKHKKEKKDKEKREGKEKKEKDQSDEKHKDKKEKKDKHRDKKKDKEKDRERDKVSSSNSVERPAQKEKDKSRYSIPDEKRQLSGYNGENRIGSSSLGSDVSDFKYVQELEKRVKNEDKGIGTQFTENFPVTYQKKDDLMVHMVGKDAVARPEGKEKSRGGKGDEPKLDGLGTKDDRRFSGNAVVRSFSEPAQSREGSQKPLAKYIERTIDGGADLKVKEGSDKAVDKQKNKERDRKSQGKVKDQREEKSKEERAKEKNDHKQTSHDKIKESKKDEILVASKTNSQHLLKDPKKHAAGEGALKKRKESETNGFLHASESRSKLPKQMVVSDPLMENGRIQEHGQMPSQAASDVQRPTNDLKPVAEDRGPNGMIDPRPVSVPSSHSLTALAQIDQISRVSNRSPHRDLKYLKEVLTVPKMDDLPVLDDDQAWLFDTSHDRSRNPMVHSSITDETPQVWGESLHIESADVYALPYVIPY